MPRAGRATGSMPWCRPLRPPREAAVLRTASSLRRRAAARHRSLRNLRRTPRAANALLTRLSVRATHPQLDRRPRNLRAVYTLGADDDPALRNLLALAGTTYEEAQQVAGGDRGRKTVW